MRMLRSGQLAVKPFVTHHFDLQEMTDAYRVFSNAAESGALKVALTGS